VAVPSIILQRLHRIRSASCQRAIDTGVEARCLAYSGEGSEILIGHTDGVPRLWDATRFELAREFIPHESEVLAVDARGSRWATSCAHGKIRIWGGFGDPIREFRDESPYPVPCWAVAWNREGTRLLSGHEDRTARVYEPERALRRKKMAAPFPVRAVAYGPEDVQVGLTEIGSAVLWEGERESSSAIFPLGEPDDDAQGVCALGFSRDRRLIAAAVRSHDIHLSHWDETVYVLRGHTDYVTSLAWSPEGRFLISGSEDCTARIWDTTTRDCVAVINDVATLRGVAFHPHGHDCATISEDGTLKIYELQSDWYDLEDAVTQATAVLDGRRAALWPTSAPLDLDFVLDVWTDLRRRGRHRKISNELAQKGETVRQTVLRLLELLCGEASTSVPTEGIARYKHPLFRVALADLRLAMDLCQRLGGDAIAQANLQRLQRVPTTELMASGLSIPPRQ
jgi:WD40 repeat protein